MGFRPFFLLAATFAASALPLWLLALSGHVAIEARGGVLSWHAHEMIFGYTTAVIAGFLLTAASRWTGRTTAVHAPLYGLALLWLAGRVTLLLSAHIPAPVVALVDLSFLPALAVAVGRPLVAERSRRNYVMVGLLGGLWIANWASHLDALGVTQSAAAWGTRLALNLVTLMMLVIGARIIPLFTRNALPGVEVRSLPRWDWATVVCMIALVACDLVRAPGALVGALAAATAGCALIATRHWGTRASLHDSLLWVLHLGYAWIPVSLLLRSLQAAGVPLIPSTPVHALTVGAIGTLTLGMMSRVTLGHSGRVIASHAVATASFLLITLAAVLRVVLPEVGAQWTRDAWLLSGAVWTLAFVGYLIRFGPMLVSPRIDGKAG